MKTYVVATPVFLVMILAGCGGSDAGTTFKTAIPGDRALNSLTDAEVASLCADAVASSAGLKQDSCRLSGFLAASFQAGLSSTATDAELQAACSQTSTSCLNNTTAPHCPLPPPAGCTATVADLTACANDSAAQTRALAGQVPACNDLSRAKIGATNADVASAFSNQPTSCQSYQAKCQSGGSGAGDGGSGPAK